MAARALPFDCTPDLFGRKVLVSNEAQLERLRGTRSIAGTLILSLEAPMSLGALEALEEVGGLEIARSRFGDIVLPNLARAGHVQIAGGAKTHTVALPRLAEVKDTLIIAGDEALSRVVLPRLARVGHSVEIAGTGLIALDGLAALRTIGGWLRVQSALQLRAMRLASLKHVGGWLVVHACHALESIDLPELTEVGLPDLFKCYARMQITGNHALRALRAPHLRAVHGHLTLSGNDRLSSLMGLGAVRAVGGRVEITRNPSLPDADTWIASLRSHGGIRAAVVCEDNRR
jgi:hypothetical protein